MCVGQPLNQDIQLHVEKEQEARRCSASQSFHGRGALMADDVACLSTSHLHLLEWHVLTG